MEEKSPISVAIIACNEEENLPGCLRSVAFARQIVLVDSGSTDRTQRIAADFGCDVFNEPWRGFGPQKQFAVDQCREDWVLVLDADERLPAETADSIKKIVAGSNLVAAGYSFPRKNFFQDRWIRHAGWWPDRVIRLFQKGRGRLTQATVHESVTVDGPVELLDVPIEHRTEGRLGPILRKIDRYSTLGARQAFSEGKRSTIWGAVLRAQFTFFQDYLFRGGFLDGRQGLTLAVTDAVNKFFKYAKLSELNRTDADGGRGGHRPLR